MCKQKKGQPLSELYCFQLLLLTGKTLSAQAPALKSIKGDTPEEQKDIIALILKMSKEEAEKWFNQNPHRVDSWKRALNLVCFTALPDSLC